MKMDYLNSRLSKLQAYKRESKPLSYTGYLSIGLGVVIAICVFVLGILIKFKIISCSAKNMECGLKCLRQLHGKEALEKNIQPIDAEEGKEPSAPNDRGNFLKLIYPRLNAEDST